MKIIEYKKFRDEMLEDKEIKAAYDTLGPEFDLVEAVIEKRIQRGMTQKELAKHAHTTQSAIARLESGTYNPSIAFLTKISKALGTSLTVSFR